MSAALALLRRVRFSTVLTVVALVVAVVSVSRSFVTTPWQAGPGYSGTTMLLVLGAFALTIAVGELNRITLPGSRESAPMSIAAAYALAMTTTVATEGPLTFGADTVLATTALGMVLALAVDRASQRPGQQYGTLATRFLSATVAAVLFREVPVWQGATLVDLQTSWSQARWLSAVSMVVVSGLALLAQSLLEATAAAVDDHLSWRVAFLDELRQVVGLSTALAASGALIALAERPLGIVAIPIFLVPLVLTQFAVRRFAAIRVTYGQTIRTLSRLTEVGGYTPADHPARVAALSVGMGRVLGLPAREALELEYAALLHDIGQVALRVPIPGGATMLAAPADQDRIAHDGAQIVRDTGVLDEVAGILEAQAKPYRHVRELGENLPLASRIIKVANAYDDLVGDRPTPASRDSAIERIHLGLGYEYDPAVVDALQRVLDLRALDERDDEGTAGGAPLRDGLR